MSTIGIINGPNLNLLGKRQPEIYGNLSFEDYLETLKDTFTSVKLHYYQSNHEGAIIDKLHEWGFELDGIVLNAGGYTHTSIALADAISSINSPVVEVHISDIYAREKFRHISYIKNVCIESIVGKGLEGYDQAIALLTKRKS
jgi:3-dehydroquinate dehydratase-2